MANFAHFLLTLLTHSFLIAAVSALIAIASPEDSFLNAVFGALGLYSTLFTACLFTIHVVVFLLSRIFKNRNPKA